MSSPVNPYSACLQSFRQNLPNDYCWQGMDGAAALLLRVLEAAYTAGALLGYDGTVSPQRAIALTNSNETFGRNALTDHLAETSARKM